MSKPAWSITDHVCLLCLGRVLERRSGEGQRVYRCSNCGVEAEVKGGPPPICACNMRHGKRDAGVRCVRNDRPRPELLCEVVVLEAA